MSVKSAVVESIGNLLKQVKLIKQAAAKGETSHPSKSVDDGTVTAPEGERSSENTADVKKNVGSTVGVAGQSDAGSADMTQASDSIGTQSQASDEVKGNVPTPKTAPEKPGQGGRGDASPEHPTSKTFGEKYSSAQELGNAILAAISVAKAGEKQAEGECAQSTDVAKTFPPKKKGEKKDEKKAEAAASAPAEAQLEKDAEAGYLAAQALYEVLTKQAGSPDQANEVVATLVKSAEADAQMFHDFLKGYEDHIKEATADEEFKKAAAYAQKIVQFLQTKKAEGKLTPELLKQAADELGGLSGEQISPEELQAMMAQGGGGAGGGMGGGGEVPPEAAGMGAEGGAGGAEGGEGAIDPQIMAIAQELAQQGVTPEELIQALQESEGGAGGMGGMGGAEGGGGGPPPEAAAHEAAEAPAEEKKEEESKAGSVKVSAQALAAALLAKRAQAKPKK